MVVVGVVGWGKWGLVVVVVGCGVEDLTHQLPQAVRYRVREHVVVHVDLHQLLHRA